MKTYDNYKPSVFDWLGDIPEHWIVRPVKHCFKFTTGGTPPTGNLNNFDGENIWVNISDLQNKTLYDSEKKISNDAIENSNIKITPQGSLLFSFKLSIGRVAFAGVDLYTNEAIFSIFPDEEVNLNFFYYSLPLQIIENASNNIYGAPMLNQELIKNARILIPSKLEQTAIANYLDEKTAEIDQTIADKEELIKLYEEEKKALINEAVTKGLNPNVKLKPSGIDWLGDIPEHWFYAAIKRVVDTKVTDGPHESPEFLEYGVPFVSAEAIKENKIDFNSCRGYISIEQDEIYSKKCKPKIGDILLVKSGSTTGKSAIVETDLNFNIWSPLALIRANEKIISYKNLHYSILSEQFRNLIELFWSFGTQPNIGMNVIENLKIAIPPIEEQTQIVEYIERETTIINEKINTTQQEIALLKEYRQALIFEAVTGKICVL